MSEGVAAGALIKAAEIGIQKGAEAGIQSEGLAMQNLQSEMGRNLAQQEVFRVGELNNPEINKAELLKEEEINAARDIKNDFDATELEKNADKYSDYEERSSINAQYEGQMHEGVSYERYYESYSNGENLTGVRANFDPHSKFDVQLPEEKYIGTYEVHNKECNNQLHKSVNSNPEVAKQFNSDQLEQIKNGDTPEGFTWHHDIPEGRMQLVDRKLHERARHTGGKAIWGGG